MWVRKSADAREDWGIKWGIYSRKIEKKKSVNGMWRGGDCMEKGQWSLFL